MKRPPLKLSGGFVPSSRADGYNPSGDRAAKAMRSRAARIMRTFTTGEIVTMLRSNPAGSPPFAAAAAELTRRGVDVEAELKGSS